MALTYNGLEQLTQVAGLAAGSGTVSHAYGYDGFRVLTRSTADATQYWFTPGISERNGLREHYIRLGDRLIARVDQRELQPLGSGGTITVGADPRPTRALLLALLALCLVLLGQAGTGTRSRPRARAAAVASLALAAGLVQSGCFLFGSGDRPLWENAGTLYFHHGISPGPTLLTREDGTVLEERRYEPFGEEIDALREPPGGGTPTTGAIDFTVDAHNILNKQSDPDTGWSYHGARWMAPETARWLTPDPPIKAPDPALIAEPWSAHPYQYVNQNPIAFWDPDGKQPVGYELSSGCAQRGSDCIEETKAWTEVSSEFAGGVPRGFWGAAKGLGNAFLHPVQTVTGVASAVRHPIRTVKRVGAAVEEALTHPDKLGEAFGGFLFGAGVAKTLGAARALGWAPEGGATFGIAASKNYRATFFAAHPELEGRVIVHHAVEQQVLKRYPGVVSEAEIHSLENLRGIPKAANPDLHLSKIRREWNQFYREHQTVTRDELLQKATEIDEKFGKEFEPSN